MWTHVLYYRVTHSCFAIPERPFLLYFFNTAPQISQTLKQPQVMFFGSVILPAIEFHVVEIRYVDFPLLSSSNKDGSVFSWLDHSYLFKSPNNILLH